MRTHLKESSHSTPAYNINNSRLNMPQESQTCSIFNFFDQIYGKKEEQKRRNKENHLNQDKKGMVESWVRQVEFEVIDQNKAKSSGISVRTEFKQSNMMRSTMCNSHQLGTFDKNKGLRVKTLNKASLKLSNTQPKRLH